MHMCVSGSGLLSIDRGLFVFGCLGFHKLGLRGESESFLTPGFPWLPDVCISKAFLAPSWHQSQGLPQKAHESWWQNKPRVLQKEGTRGSQQAITHKAAIVSSLNQAIGTKSLYPLFFGQFSASTNDQSTPRGDRAAWLGWEESWGQTLYVSAKLRAYLLNTAGFGLINGFGFLKNFLSKLKKRYMLIVRIQTV